MKKQTVLFLLFLLTAVPCTAFSQSAQELVGQARQHIGFKQSENALDTLDKALELNPAYAEAYYLKGVVYHYLLHRSEEALREFNKAIVLNQKNCDYYFDRATVFEKLGKEKEAVKDYRLAARLGSNIAKQVLKGKGIKW